jgi:hypothetical protein
VFEDKGCPIIVQAIIIKNKKPRMVAKSTQQQAGRNITAVDNHKVSRSHNS